MSVPGTRGPRGTRNLTLVAIGVLALVVLVSGVFALFDNSGGEEQGPWGSYASGWTPLPAPPQWRSNAGLVWTGSSLLYWGGLAEPQDHTPLADGYAYDPISRAWSTIPAAPAGGNVAAGIWDGTRAFFFIANDDGVRTDAFDPATERWTTYPDGPRGPTETSSWTLVGSFVVVFGGGGGLAASAKGWTFSTRDGSWGKLPTAVYPMSVPMTTAATPFDVISIGTGDFRLGADMLQAQSFDLTRPVGWNALPPTGLDPVAAGIATVAGRTIVWQTTTGRSIEWLPDEDRWGAIAFPDVVPTDCGADGAAIEGYAFTWNCGQPLVWSGATSTWSIVDRPFPEIDQGGLAIGFAVGAGQGFVISEAEPQQIGDFGRITTAPFLWFWKPPAS